MNDAHRSRMKEKNIRRLCKIAGLVPNHGITVEVFEYIYPGKWYILLLEMGWHQSHLDITNVAKGQKDTDITISQVYNSLSSEMQITHISEDSYTTHVGLSTIHCITHLYGSHMMVTGAIPAEASRHIHL